MRRSFLAIAVALPLVVLALGIVRSERHLADGRRWTFDVTGYDPRDLLRGHYIQYRLVFEDADLPVVGAVDGAPCDDETGETCCLCLLGDLENGRTLVERTTCELARSECEGALQLRYLGELQRYYIAEERAAELTQIFQDASRGNRARLVVAIDAAGRPQIDTLLVDGMAIEQARRPAAPSGLPNPGADDPGGGADDAGGRAHDVPGSAGELSDPAGGNPPPPSPPER
jgi:hypothetical protein